VKFAVPAALICAALAFILRFMAQDALPLDYDEPIYLNGAQEYARAVRAGDWSALREDASPENPQLMKLLFGGALLTVPAAEPIPMLPNVEAPADALRAARLAAVGAGALHAAALAFVDPLAGLLLAVYSGHVKYTSLVMLEALPGLTALLCVVMHRRARGRWGAWMAASAVMLGLTAAGKYMYCVAALAIVAEALWRARGGSIRRLWPLLPWGALAIAVFFAVSPYLWSDPIGKVRDSLFFHARNASVAESAANTDKFVWWQPLGWLGASVPRNDLAVPLRPDAAIAVAAACGVPALWRRRRVFALWLLFGVAFLLIYPNKWPQYALIVTTPLCMAASAAARGLVNVVRRRRRYVAGLSRETHHFPPRSGEAGGAFRGFRRAPIDGSRKFTLNGGSARRTYALALAAAMGAASAAGVAVLADDPYNADPEFREAMRLVQASMAPDEIAFAVFADPAARAAVLEPGWRSWNALPPAALLGAPHGMLGYDEAATLLNRAAGRHGVWLLTYQKAFGDPADTMETLLQRQTPTNGPAQALQFERGYALVHYRFGSGYEPLPVPAPRLTGFAESGEHDGALLSEGCASLRPTRVGAGGGTLEVVCFWRSAPYKTLPWDTRVRSTLRDARGGVVVQSEPLIARSGFPWFRYQGVITGVYLLTLPPGTAPGRYELTVQPMVPGTDAVSVIHATIDLLH